MSHFQTFQVFPSIPAPLSFLETLMRNMWWCWHLDAIELFRRVEPRLWEKAGRNPIAFSTLIPQKRFEELAKDDGFLSHLQRVKKLFEEQVQSPVDRSDSPLGEKETIAYFSMEFGIHESLPLFAGGLGVLAGDHLKASSDLALPLNGVGLLYQKGYFHQFLSHEGWQQEEYPETDLFRLPIERVKDNTGKEVRLCVDGPAGKINAVVWKVKVGRINLFLLDTNLKENSHEIREITSRLYPADSKIRLAQEVLLGIGGMRALEIMGKLPAVSHMNEGHCAFLSIERIGQIMSSYNVDLEVASEIMARSNVFTTHTPVAAGHDVFPADMVKPYLRSYPERLGASLDEIVSWGQHVGDSPNGPVSMFVLALRNSQYCNGVSQLHGKVARRMWSHVWPSRSEDEIPISHITNGIHIPSWISVENSLLFERHLGPDWYMQITNPETTERINAIYDEELWRAHEMSRSRLVRSCRALMVKQNGRRNAPKSMMKEAQSVLDQGALTIAFARRFATYKRATLLLKDPDRLEAILNSEEYPVQFIFAGKAHPKDNEGKELIKSIVDFAGKPGMQHKIVFLEDYDIDIARHLVQGADVWLNTPRRPFEACGTSGIKAAVNGVLNLSVLDGWWCEGFTEETGWGLGNGEEYRDHNYQDAVESQALYNILENDVIPCFYERKERDLPIRWLKMMKASMTMGILNFCAQGMVGKYKKKFYLPAAKRFKELVNNDAQEAKRLRDTHQKLLRLWKGISVEHPLRESDGPFRVGEALNITTVVHLGNLRPEDVIVELYYGNMKSIDTLSTSRPETMGLKEKGSNGDYLYSCTINCCFSGRFGFTARVIPNGDEMIKNAPGFMTWAGE